MLQHAIGAARGTADPAAAQSGKQSKFVGSHLPYWVPGATLKKVAITEMRHAEAISERIVLLGGEPTTEPTPITIGTTPKAMLEIDRRVEAGAIELYQQIIDVAQDERDDVTADLFRKILVDEERHHQLFSALLAEG
jgi:bacterioferritin